MSVDVSVRHRCTEALLATVLQAPGGDFVIPLATTGASRETVHTGRVGVEVGSNKLSLGSPSLVPVLKPEVN